MGRVVYLFWASCCSPVLCEGSDLALPAQHSHGDSFSKANGAVVIESLPCTV